MIDVTVATTVERPVDEVFAFVADIENEPRWHTDILETERLTEGDVKEGTKSDRVQITADVPTWGDSRDSEV